MKTVFLTLSILCAGKCLSQDNCAQFEFKGFGSNTNNWRNEVPFERLSRTDYTNRVKKFKDFTTEDDFRELYRVCELKRNNLEGLVIARAFAGQLEMYFVPKNGTQPFLLASLEANSDEILRKKSEFVAGILKMTSIYSSTEDNRMYEDSVVNFYGNIKLNKFLKVRTDSVRTYFKGK